MGTYTDRQVVIIRAHNGARAVGFSKTGESWKYYPATVDRIAQVSRACVKAHMSFTGEFVDETGSYELVI